MRTAPIAEFPNLQFCLIFVLTGDEGNKTKKHEFLKMGGELGHLSNLKRKDHNHVHLSNVLVPVLVHCSVNMQICNCQICLQAKNIEICKVMGHIMLKLNGESSFYEITRFFGISFYFYL